MGYLAIQKYYSRITINNFCLSRRSDTIYGDDYSPCECVEQEMCRWNWTQQLGPPYCVFDLMELPGWAIYVPCLVGGRGTEVTPTR